MLCRSRLFDGLIVGSNNEQVVVLVEYSTIYYNMSSFTFTYSYASGGVRAVMWWGGGGERVRGAAPLTVDADLALLIKCTLSVLHIFAFRLTVNLNSSANSVLSSCDYVYTDTYVLLLLLIK